MSIRYRCEECGEVMKIRDSLAGTRGKCPHCRVKFTVPAQSTLSEEEYAAEQSNSSLSNGSSLELGGESPSSPSLQAGPPSSSKLVPPAKAAPSSTKLNPAEKESPPASSPKLSPAAAGDASASSTKLPPANPSKASVSGTKLPPPPQAKPPIAEPAPEVSESEPVEPPADDFDAAAFLMEDTGPDEKKTAGLAKQVPADTKPAVDKMGRRYFGAAPKAAAAAAPPEDEVGASVTIKATLPVEPVRAKIDWKDSRKRLIRLSPWMLVTVVVAGLIYWIADARMNPALPLPLLAEIHGNVKLKGASAARLIVHLTPVNATQGLSTSGQTIRLTDALGATNENGDFQISYLGQPGSPYGKVRIWLEPVEPADYKNIPAKYQQPGPDIREVREAGNENKFQLELND